MNRDFVWFVIVIILGGNTLVMLNSEEATDPNLIDIEELTCSLGEIMVSNVSLGEGYECTEFDPHSITHAHPAPVLSVSNVIDNGSAIAIFGDVDHLHPNEISVRLSLDEDVTISTQPNMDGAWSLTVNSSAEQFYLNITANHDLEETTSNTTFIEINRTASAERTETRVNHRISRSCPHITVSTNSRFLRTSCVGLTWLAMTECRSCSRRNCRPTASSQNPSW